jgi:hypothetical protein
MRRATRANVYNTKPWRNIDLINIFKIESEEIDEQRR